MIRPPAQSNEPITPETVKAEVERLSKLANNDLKAAWASEFRRPPPKGLWRDLLVRTLAWRIQEKALGGHEKGTLRLLEAHGQKRAGDQLYRRLKPGTVLVREFSGVRHTVTIVPEGFMWRDEVYSSLTAIARIITGTNWNGPRFFGLRDGGSRGAISPSDTSA